VMTVQPSLGARESFFNRVVIEGVWWQVYQLAFCDNNLCDLLGVEMEQICMSLFLNKLLYLVCMVNATVVKY
jgi:disulfide bond formation protein DsbB